MEPKAGIVVVDTSTNKNEDVRSLRVGVRDSAWELPFCEVFDVLGYRFHRDGKGFPGAECSMCKALGSWWRDKYIYRTKTVTMTTKCERVHSNVYSTVLNGSINWPWSGAMINKVRGVGVPDFCASPSDPRNLGNLQNQNFAVHEALRAEDGPAHC